MTIRSANAKIFASQSPTRDFEERVGRSVMKQIFSLWAASDERSGDWQLARARPKSIFLMERDDVDGDEHACREPLLKVAILTI